MAGLRLHNFFRSSTSFRVRIALQMKGLDYESLSYLLKQGEQRSVLMLAMNPQGLVPTLELGNGLSLSQSMAIIEWLDELYPTPALMPPRSLARARVRSLAQMVACDIHPINNLRVLSYLQAEFGADENAVKKWFCHWVKETFQALEQRLFSEPDTGQFCQGDTPGLADICLVAQVYNNRRFAVDMTAYPTINTIFDRCMNIDAFDKARPDAQPDAH